MAFIKVDKKNIYYEEYGDRGKPTIVYLHGGPGESCLTYSYQAKELGKIFHIISFDQYGVFRSDAILENEVAGVFFHVELIEKMRIALDIKSWIPLGHSFGGMLALIYAHCYPDSIDAVIYDCPMWSAFHTARAIALAVKPYYEQKEMNVQLELVDEILKDTISPREAFMKAMTIEFDNGLNRFCHVIESDRYNAYINEHISDPQVSDECWGKYISFRQKIFEAEDFYGDYLQYLSEIDKPQLLLVGEYDMTCGSYEQEWFKKNVQNGTVRILENSAHLSWFEYPEKYTELVTCFVDAV